MVKILNQFHGNATINFVALRLRSDQLREKIRNSFDSSSAFQVTMTVRQM
ncbi:MAG: hypothetical protein IPH08_06335 [Rhodocyclaceae bacterium]|jgi:hypothetical protein|nr:hypothetical protein [Rhodocyclaceae bacterium]